MWVSQKISGTYCSRTIQYYLILVSSIIFLHNHPYFNAFSAPAHKYHCAQ